MEALRLMELYSEISDVNYSYVTLQYNYGSRMMVQYIFTEQDKLLDGHTPVN